MKKWILWVTVGGLFVAGLWSWPVFAVNSASNGYEMSEAQFGAGGMLNSCSGQYCAKASIGPMGGSTPATNGASTANFQPIEDNNPVLEVIVEPGESNLGVLSTDKTATRTSIVRVRNHMGSGYFLQVIGNPPKFGNHTLKTPTTPTDSQKGKEQFAINLVANTAPSLGADPLQVPSGQATFGQVASNYGVANKFMYHSGDVVAQSNAPSGRTDYTISMIVNVSGTTPAGHFTGDFSVVAIPMY